MRILKLTGISAMLLVLAACVTINIYFPAAQAEEAAERIVDDILGKDAEKGDAESKKEKGANLGLPNPGQWVFSPLEWLIPSAHAASPNFDVSSPSVRKLQASMKSRHRSLATYYGSGAVGFTSNALVAVRDSKAVPLKERQRVKSLVSAENRDRNQLYKAIADANGHPEWEPDIRNTFAKKWVQKASQGWWYQTSSGKWKTK